MALPGVVTREQQWLAARTEQVTVDQDHPEYNYRVEPQLAASADPAFTG
jgi:hypothetical protein